MKKSNTQILVGALVSYLAIFVSVVSSLLYTPWMKDSIGDAHYGLYTLAGSLISIFIMDFGLSTSVTRFVAKYRAENNSAAVGDVIGCVVKLYVIIDVVIAAVLVLVYPLIDKIYVGLKPSEIVVFKKVFLIIGTYSIISFPFTPLTGILNAYEKFIQVKLCDMFQKLFTILLVVVAISMNHGVVALVLMNAVSGLVTIALKLWIIRSAVHIRMNLKAKDREMLKSLLSFSLWVTVLALAQRLIFSIAPSILGITADSLEIARFAPAAQLEGYFFTFAYAINGLFLPTVARYEASNDIASFEKLLIKVGRYQIIFLGLIFVGIATLGREFMQLWMGEQYRACGVYAMLMIAPSLLMYPQQLANTLITVRGKVKYQAIAALIIGVVSVLLSLILTPKLGALGSSISICCAYAINFFFLNWIYRWQLHLEMKNFYIRVYARYLPIICGAILFGSLTGGNIPLGGWGGFLVKVFAISVFFLFLIFAFGVSGQERKMVIAGIVRLFTKEKKHGDTTDRNS